MPLFSLIIHTKQSIRLSGVICLLCVKNEIRRNKVRFFGLFDDMLCAKVINGFNLFIIHTRTKTVRIVLNIYGINTKSQSVHVEFFLNFILHLWKKSFVVQS